MAAVVAVGVLRLDFLIVRAAAMGWTGNAVPVVIVIFALHTGNTFYNICYPTFPELDSNHRPLPRHGPLVKDSTRLRVDLQIHHDMSKKSTHVATRDFVYSWEEFKPFELPVTINVSASRLQTKRDANVWLHARVTEVTSHCPTGA